VFLLGVLELKRNIGVIILPSENIWCLQMSRSLSLSYFSPQYLVIASKIIFFPLFVSLPAPASDDSSLVPLVATSEPPASKLVRDFRYVYTHCQKVPVSEPVSVDPSPVDGPPPQPSASPSDLDISIALRKGNWSCANHIISKFIFYDHLNSTFLLFALFVSSEYMIRFCEETLFVPA